MMTLLEIDHRDAVPVKDGAAEPGWERASKLAPARALEAVQAWFHVAEAAGRGLALSPGVVVVRGDVLKILPTEGAATMNDVAATIEALVDGAVEPPLAELCSRAHLRAFGSLDELRLAVDTARVQVEKRGPPMIEWNTGAGASESRPMGENSLTIAGVRVTYAKGRHLLRGRTLWDGDEIHLGALTLRYRAGVIAPATVSRPKRASAAHVVAERQAAPAPAVKPVPAPKPTPAPSQPQKTMMAVDPPPGLAPPGLAPPPPPAMAPAPAAEERREVKAVEPEAPAAPAQARETPMHLDENVQFTVYRPKAITPERWHALLAFAHLAERRPDEQEAPDPVEEVVRQAKAILGGDAAAYADVTQDSRAAVPRDGELTITPVIDGVEVNPRARSFLWTEPVHREEFRIRAPASLDGNTARGRVTVWLGSLILAEVPIAVRVARQVPAADAQPAPAKARPYRRIFASYSHKDAAIVDEMSRFARSLGDEYVRDWIHLRSGEVWGDRLRQMISDADVFQLFWSTSSMRSKFVRDEWEYALSLGREHFVRPTYWEEPLPRDAAAGLPPDSLVRLHFQRLAVASATASPVPVPDPKPGAMSSFNAPPPPGARPSLPAPDPVASPSEPAAAPGRNWLVIALMLLGIVAAIIAAIALS